MRQLRYCLFMFCLLVVIPVTAGAEVPFELDVRAGAAVTIPSYRDIVTDGAFLGAMVLARVSPPLSFGIEFAGNVGHSLNTFFPSSTSVSFIQVTPVIRLQTSFSENVTGFFLVGFGYYHSDYTVVTYDSFGVNAGFGLLFAIAPNVSAGVDVRYHRIMEEGADPHYVVPAVILTYTP
jgi:hypothetical protein